MIGAWYRKLLWWKVGQPVQLGFPVFGGWMMTVKDHEDRALSVVFSEKQAREIARRIIAFYGEHEAEELQ